MTHSDPTPWRTSPVRDLLAQVRKSCQFEDGWFTFDRSILPVLADALEDAGCGDLEILTPLRSDRYHDGRRFHVLAVVALLEGGPAERGVRTLVEIAEACDITLNALMEAGLQYLWWGEHTRQSGGESWRNGFDGQAAAFWTAFGRVTGADVRDDLWAGGDNIFSCSC